MSIQTVSGIKDVLSQYDAKGWSKTADINEFSDSLSLSFDQLKSPKTDQTFGEVLASSLNDVNKLQTDANVAIQKLVSGESKNLHETMLTVEKAEIAFKTMNQVRQKVIDAYREIMRMQI